jgi:hypothetical protein
LDKSIGGFFYKRKSYYFDRKDKIKTKSWSGLFSKFGSVKYDKRYFHLDVTSQMLSYGKDEFSAINNPSYSVNFRDIISVTKNVVSMPYQNEKGDISFKEVSIYDTDPDLHRGPYDKSQNAFEIKIENRMLTCYTDDNIRAEQFVLYLERVLELKDQVMQKQKKEDVHLAMQIKEHQEQQMLKIYGKTEDMN